MCPLNIAFKTYSPESNSFGSAQKATFYQSPPQYSPSQPDINRDKLPSTMAITTVSLIRGGTEVEMLPVQLTCQTLSRVFGGKNDHRSMLKMKESMPPMFI